jgi:hypothetical protein
MTGNHPHSTTAMAMISTRTLCCFNIHVWHICYLDRKTLPAIHMSMTLGLYRSWYINMTLLSDRNQSFSKGFCPWLIQYIIITLAIIYIYICCTQHFWEFVLLSCATALIDSFIISLLKLVELFEWFRM